MVLVGMDNTMYGIIENGKPTDQYKNDFSIYYDNNSGTFVEFVAGNDEIDMSWFKDFEGDYIYHATTDPEYNTSNYFSIVSKSGSYFWHQFAIYFSSYRYDGGPLEITSSETGPLNAQMFSDYVDAALLVNSSYFEPIALVASGNKLYKAAYLKGENGTVLKGDFPARIAGIAVKDLTYDDYNSHLGVVLEDGNFYVFEVKRDKNSTEVVLEELFHKNLKELNPNFGKVVDFVVKYGGNGENISISRPF